MKALLLFAGLFLFLSAQAQWVQEAELGTNDRFSAVDFTINGEAYVLGGLSYNSTTYTGYSGVWKLDQSSETWIQVSTYPQGKMYEGIAFVIDGIAYVGLGADQSGITNNKLWAYNPISNTWAPKANFPGQGRIHAFSFTADGKGYIGTGVYFLGSTTNFLDDFWAYDPITDSWSQKSNYPGGGAIGIAAMTINNTGYAGLGDNGPSFLPDFYRYNPDNDDWSTMAPYTGENGSFYASTTANGKGYIIGGEKAHLQYTDQMWSYDPNANVWAPSFDFTGMPRAFANLFFVNNSFYYGLGLVGPLDSQASNEIWSYSLATSVWGNEIEEVAIKLYPNPATEQIQITLPAGEQLQKVALQTLLGETVFEGRETLVPVSSLANQTYVVAVHLETQVIYRRVIKQ